MAVCQPFIDAGFIVMTPMLRGENGNPGDFEMYFGEVDDAQAAIRWIATQKGVNKHRIYAFGHSAGGVISALLSLYPDLPVKLTGSCGGLYGSHLFGDDRMTPFNPKDRRECELRSLIGHVPEMKMRHIAYVATEDRYQEARAAWEEKRTGSKLEIVMLPGTHFSILDESIRKYLERVK
jgi:acetyl esterase/lipase